jgi:hypothetical protein
LFCFGDVLNVLPLLALTSIPLSPSWPGKPQIEPTPSSVLPVSNHCFLSVLWLMHIKARNM